MMLSHAKTTQPTKDETLTALERLYQAMLVAEQLMQEAAAEHWQSFQQQMREKVGAEAIHLDEPYLDAELATFQLQLMETLERIFNRIADPLLGEKQHPPEYYPALAMYGLPMKAINYNAVTVADIEDRIAIESVRATRRLKQSLDEKRQRNFGMQFYVWRTVGDERVRDSHGALEGQLCRWDEGTKPGEEYGCRCWAEPSTHGIDDPPIEPVYPELWLIALGRALRGIANVLTHVRTKLERVRRKPEEKPEQSPASRTPDDKIFERPDKVPENWEKTPSNKGEGVRYRDPNNPHNEVRIQKGDPNVSNPSQQQDYVKWKRNGQWLDKDGNPVPGDTPEAHIPIEEFDFDPEMFR